MPAPKRLEYLSATLRRTCLERALGRIRSISQTKLEVSGLSDRANLGDQVLVQGRAKSLAGEVIAVADSGATVLVDGETSGLSLNDPVTLLGALVLAPDDDWLGRVVDPCGRPLDHRPLPSGLKDMSLSAAPPPATGRRGFGKRIETGFAVMNTVLPIVCGQRLGVFAGSGVGKSSLLGMLCTDLVADVVVIGLIGERGREVSAFVNQVLVKRALSRSVIVAATSDQSPVMRRRAGNATMAVAEHFRDQGKSVLVLMDSVTRLAEAHREIATAAGEPATMRGHPPSLIPYLASLTERAGPGAGSQGDITAVFTVLVAGSDMEEPIADILRGTLDGHIVLSRDLAERGHFPAIDVLHSVSRALPHAATKDENALIADLRRVLSTWRESEVLVRSGLYQAGANHELDRAVSLMPRIQEFLTARHQSSIQDAFALLERILKGVDLEGSHESCPARSE